MAWSEAARLASVEARKRRRSQAVRNVGLNIGPRGSLSHLAGKVLMSRNRVAIAKLKLDEINTRLKATKGRLAAAQASLRRGPNRVGG